jgi:hypothetical protein
MFLGKYAKQFQEDKDRKIVWDSLVKNMDELNFTNRE